MKKLYIIQVLLLFCISIMAQNTDKTFTISGTVVDPAFNNEPMIGVNVHLKDRPGVGTTTDIDGKFRIKASKGDVLLFDYIGYKRTEYMARGPQENLVIKLTAATETLDEVVVVGMGTQRKVSVVGAITNVDMADLTVPGTSITNTLGGRVPGIISLQESGEPGKNISEFWIRGIGTFGANASALVLIDGLEGNLSEVDPADVESFSVLKDASATAVYGVRGANGVILVTTKRGTVDKLRITARANFTISQLRRMPDFLGAYDYAQLANEARVVSGNEPLYSPMEMDLIQYQLDPDLYPNVDWRDVIIRNTSFQQTYYLSAQGGGSIARYFVSLGMSKEDAAYKQDKASKYKVNAGYNTYNYRSNLDVNITKSTTAFIGLDGYINHTNQPGMANTNYLWNAQAMLTPLTIPLQYSTGQIPAYGPTNAYSPYVMLNNTGIATAEQYRHKVTLAVTQDMSSILKGLKLKVQGAIDSRVDYNETRFIMPEMYSAVGRSTNGELQLVKKVDAQPASFSKNVYHWRKYHFEGTANYETVFNQDHRFSALLYYYMSDEKYTKDISDSMSAIPKRYQGLSGRITYGFKDTYFIDANFGYTGSENFQPGKQFGFFPSAAIGWIPTNYEFVQKALPWLDFLKLRFSYGQVGNDRITKARFPYLTLVQGSSAGWGATGGGITEQIVGADNLEWEKATKADIGLEVKMFDDKFSFVVDYFRDQRDGIFQQRTQVPDFAGIITMPFGNVGKMMSQGADGNFTYSQKLGRDMSLTLRGNFTYSVNKVQNWEQAYPKYPYQQIAGNPHNIQRGYIALGLFRDEQDVKSSPTQFGTVRPGDIKYKDVNADGKINTDDQVPLSFSNYPRLMYGFGLEFNYKALTVSVLFKGTGNTDFYRVGLGNEYGYVPFHGGEVGNVPVAASIQANRWTPAWYSGNPATENPNAMFPRLSYGKNENNSQLSTFWRGNSKYLRLQEVNINYNLKTKGFVKRLGIQSFDFQLVGSNLAVWSSVKDVDPEQAAKNGNVYPIPARYAFQTYINF